MMSSVIPSLKYSCRSPSFVEWQDRIAGFSLVLLRFFLSLRPEQRDYPPRRGKLEPLSNSSKSARPYLESQVQTVAK